MSHVKQKQKYENFWCHCPVSLILLILHSIIIIIIIIIVIIIIKNEKIRVKLCENTAGALYIVSNVTVTWLYVSKTWWY